MSTTAAPAESPSATGAPGSPARAPGETCPLCGAPLHPEQEWCLRCGAAARTRLAASPNWKAPLLGAIAVAVLSLGVLAAALVKLAGDSGPGAPPTTRTVTTAAAATPSAIVPTTPTVTTPVPVPGGSTPTTSTPKTAPRSSTPGVTTPGKTSSSPKSSPRIGGLSPALSKRLLELSRRQAQKGR